MSKEYVLIKDIVIPAGTKLSEAPIKVERYTKDFYECFIGLTDDTCGSFVYPVEGDDEDLLREYFVELK